MYGCVCMVVVGSDRIRGACVCIKSEIKEDGSEDKRGGAKPSARLSDLRWIRTRWKGLEEDTSLVYKEREGSTACFRAKDVVHVCVVTEVSSAWVCVDGAMDKCVLAGEGAAALAGDVVVGVGAVFEGVTGSEVVVGKAACTGCVQLPVPVVVLLPSVDSDEKRGWVEGVVPGPWNAGHWSVSTVRVVPFESQGG